MSATQLEAFTYQGYLAANPPTPEEIAQGEFLRVAQAWGSVPAYLNTKSTVFFWTALCVSRRPYDGAPAKVAGPKGAFCQTKEVNRGQVVLGEDACVWFVTEFRLSIPYYVRSFTVKSGALSVGVSFEARNRAIFAGWGKVCNAAGDEEGYARWSQAHRAANAAEVPPECGPLMSIVTPAYQTPPAFLRELLDSVVAQTYARWELVVVNASPEDAAMQAVLDEYTHECRIKVVPVAENLGIAGNTNVGINAATGDYVSFLDHDDLIEPNALAAMVAAIAAYGGPVDLLYCDEDSINEDGRYLLPLFKPDFNRDLEYSNNYIVHMLTVSRYALERTQRSGKEMDGSQDYDMTLKALEVARGVVHVPKVLYHWRIHSASTNANPDAKPYVVQSSIRALQGHFARCGIEAQVSKDPAPFTYRSVFGGVSQGVASPEDDVRLDAGYWALSAAGNLVYLGASGGFDAAGFAGALDACREEILVVVQQAVALSRSSVLALAGYFARPEVFAVSPQVVREDGLLDYAGMVVCPNGHLLRMGRLLPQMDRGYIGRTNHPYDALVVNPELCALRVGAARTMPPTQAYDGGLEYVLADVFAQAWQAGLLNVYTPVAVARLVQPRSMMVPCAQQDSPEARQLFLQQWGSVLVGGADPTHTPHLDPCSPYYRLPEQE
ncbi:MAG: glycosyltransferase [Coriobacteriia bacterium]|nr:glycosyltransferase [Coriobacteriia bacterium]